MSATPVQSTSGFPKRVVPPVELPAGGTELARAGAAELGWNGTMLEMDLLGRRVWVCARLRTAEHAERLAAGIDPVTDRADVSTWTWPELVLSAPPEAAEILGVLAVARHWRTGMASVVHIARYYRAAALVLPETIARSTDYVDNCLPRARTYGLGLVSAGEGAPDADVYLDHAGHAGREPAEPDALSRWINELVYQRLLGEAVAPEHVALA